MSLLGYHGFNNWENHFMEDENKEIIFCLDLNWKQEKMILIMLKIN